MDSDNKDIISRQATLDAIFNDWDGMVVSLPTLIKCIPSTQKKGKWIYDSEAYPLGNPYGHYDCNRCGESVPHKTNFCPNCGADMRESHG